MDNIAILQQDDDDEILLQLLLDIISGVEKLTVQTAPLITHIARTL